MYLWNKNKSMPLLWFLIFSGCPYENFPIWIQIASSCFKSAFSPELHILQRRQASGEANIFVVPALMILDLSIPRYVLFVEFLQVFLIIILKMNLFVRYVGKVLTSLIGRDRWAFMITSCGN